MREYDAVIVILAYWRGSLVNGFNMSYTEMEVEEALRQNKPILAYSICPVKGAKPAIHYEEGTAAERARLRRQLESFVKVGTFGRSQQFGTAGARQPPNVRARFSDVCRQRSAA